MRLLSKTGEQILSISDWFAKAPPKQGARHWKDYRSAKELAKAWFRSPCPAPPHEFFDFLLQVLPGTGITVTDAYPESIVTLDQFSGEQRNTDLVVLGTAGTGRLAVSVEAKADEPFGDSLVGEYYDRRLAVSNSNLPARIDGLTRGLFGKALDSVIRSLRYQLLHATAAALISADQHHADIAIFVIHEFVCAHLNSAKLARNDLDWRAFVAALTQDSAASHIPPRPYVGPIRVLGGEHIPSGIPLYLGKIQTVLG